MKSPLRAVLALHSMEDVELLRSLLSHLGHEVTAIAHSGPELIEQCRQHSADLILADLYLPDGDSLEALRSVWSVSPVPAILMAAEFGTPLPGEDIEAVLGYLVKPVSEAALRAAIGLTLRCFEQMQALHQQAAELRQALEDRKLIERAKGILTRRLRIDEPEAFFRLRKLSSDRNWKLIDIARKVVKAEEIFEALDRTGAGSP